MKYIGPLQVLFFITCIIFFLLALDGYKRRKLNVMHFVVFFGGSIMVAIFAWNIDLLNTFGRYFGLQRGADLLVYVAIIILFYLYFGLNNKNIRLEIQQTNILRHIAISQAIGNLDPQSTVALIMPCYKNHAKLSLIHSILDQGYGIVFIDDGYNSIKLIESLRLLAVSGYNIVVISHPYNLGQGAALQTGQLYVSKQQDIPYVMHFDSDGQHDIQDIPVFLDVLKENTDLDIVLGSRFLGIENDIPFWRRLNKKLQIIFTKIVIGLPLTDTHNGLRMMKHSVLDKLTITLDDYTHASEIEFLVKQNKLARKELPMHVIYTDEHIAGGQPLSNAITIAKKILYRLFFFR